MEEKRAEQGVGDAPPGKEWVASGGAQGRRRLWSRRES